ncbi:hemerythrin domain-containing protein [Mycolicibacter minnesotensis]
MAHMTLRNRADVVGYLTAQHRRIKELFDETLLAAGPERAASFVRLRGLLAVHETAEEEIVHPRAARELEQGQTTVRRLLHDEQNARSTLGDLERVHVDSEFFTERLRELRDAVLAHGAREERDEFTELDGQLSDDELRCLDRAVVLSEAIAQARPAAAGVAEVSSAPHGLSFAQMRDRAREAIVS